MDFSSWQTWALIAVGVLVVLWLIGAIFGDKDTAKPAPRPESGRGDPLAVQAATLAAISARAMNFDRDMYIDDMTADQLEDEHVWRTAFITAYNIVWNLGPQKDNPFEKICTAITGRPADPQLAGLSEYYFDTVYEPMMAVPDDRYWDEELIALKDQWTTQKREQILLAALIPLHMANELHIAIRDAPIPEGETGGAHLMPHIDRVGEAFFGVEAPERMDTLRAQAAQMANTIEF
ncbi:hypothetical protein HNE_1304 [Hyphomonas neptunium ATCC 15444]|uniref:Uncharacterized protein n=2 Tax=Hyphomonas TaxID=85 RepID=Q0C2M1_HYPNA|nr:MULTISPECIES: hypothetical protein [Hyphomonas]ABI75443.1 hypothetical protein HNE_1304 [Hyphomonas neptunium ATCC 15444]KCZ95743.1 hypothetical protein HHI_03192 [Hyphomonas hirschiana VP5]